MAASETASDGLAIALFGPLKVGIGGHPLPPLRSRKALWLLALLALRHDRPVEREWLAGTLWPEVNQSRAFSNLRPVVSELRQALGSQAFRLRSPDRFTLLLDLTGAEVDVCAFDVAMESGELPALERAVALYRGPLLEGCAEEWAFQERQSREQDCLRALQTLAGAALAAGDYAAAASYYRRAVGLDPWRETARRGLMEALAGGGDRNAALHVYRQYVALLRDSPQAVPDEQTRALYSRLRAEASRPVVPQQAVAGAATTAPSVTGYVPHALTELVGREDERLEIAACLRRSRLVTLTGMGGIGKTRLAMAVADEVVREYPDGVWLVALEALAEDAQVFAQIASVLGVKEDRAGRGLTACVLEHLARRRLLLVLDNCEHLLAASAEAAARLLAECANVRILATSREALGITGELAWTVPALTAPDAAHLPEKRATLLRVVTGYESVQLFVERAEAVQKTFALTGDNARTVAQICFRLEGIPLAIELAAARVRVMTVEQIAARLDSSLGLLVGGSRTAKARQQTLRATLDWSYELLSEPERLLLGRLSVFAGGWTLEAAEAVCADGETARPTRDAPPALPQGDVLALLTALVDKSLVAFGEGAPESGGRFRMLEVVRQFARERLAARGEEPALLLGHQDWFVALAEAAEPQLRGAEQGTWLRRLANEYDNLRVVLDRSEQGVCSAESALRLAGALWRFWYMRGDYGEGRNYLTRALARGDTKARTATRAKALNAAGALAFRQGDYAAAQALFEESLAIRQEREDDLGIAEVLGNLGNLRLEQGDHAGAQALYEESLTIRRQRGDIRGIALLLSNTASIALKRGDFAGARSQYEESLLLYREVSDRFGIAWALNSLGNVISIQGDLVRAQALYEESLSSLKELGDRHGIAWTLNRQGNIAFRRGDYTLAKALYQEALSVFQALGDKRGIAGTLQYLGDTAFHQGDLASAHALYEDGLSVFKELRATRGIAWTLHKLGSLAYARRDDATGRALFAECLPLFKGLDEKTGILMTLRELASATQSRDVPSAVSLSGAVHALRNTIGAEGFVTDEEDYERQLGEARSAIGEDDFVAAWEAGRAMTWGQAADFALEVLKGERQ